MLPPHKLARLPRSQRLRKIEKIFALAEKETISFMVNHGENAVNIGLFDNEKTRSFAETAELLAADTLFQAAAIEAFREAALVFRRPGDTAAVRRALNAIRHILLAETGRFPADWDFIDSGGRLDPSRRRPFPGMMVYLEDIRSPFNVGAMFRAAESFGVEKIIISPLCASPRHPRAERSAMGCVDALPWEYFNFSVNRDFDMVNGGDSSCPVFALETGGIPLAEFPFPKQGLLIAGSEELGVSPAALAAADSSLGRVSIPCYGAKGSLNVSVAFGIVTQAWAQALRTRN